MVNWTVAKNINKKIILRNGVWIYILDRITSGSDAYETGSLTSYGYGDVTTYFTTGSMQVLIKQSETKDIALEVGFTYEDYQDVYYDPDETIEQWNILIYPTGSDGVKYIILPTQTYRFEETGITVTKHVRARKMFPRSGSAN